MEEKVDLNRAGDREILNIQGISDAVALQIIRYRKEKGRIRDWGELEGLMGVSNSVMHTLKERATLGKE